MASAEWTSPADIRAELQRAWDRGRILAARFAEAPLFPMRVKLRRPTARDLGERFDDVRRWIRDLEEGSRAPTGGGYEVQWTEVNHRQLGRNRVPASVVVPTELDALLMLGKQRAAARFADIVERTLPPYPALRAWLARKPLVALEHAEVWPRILAVVAWFAAHPRSGHYVRQIEVRGVDTKFVELHRSLLGELLSCALPTEAVDGAAASFEGRYGLRTKPATVRIRVLDPTQAIAGLTDVAAPIEQLAEHPPLGGRVFITENEINGLAFPDLPDAIVVFGLGYGVETLARLPWLEHRDVVYWGDIDTHGFAMLDRLRLHFPRVRSFLMDRETLLAHRTHWSREDRPYLGTCPRLRDPEREVLEELQRDVHGVRVRLEQERIDFGAVARALAEIDVKP